MATDPTTIPQLADLQQAKKDMTDINSFTLSQSDTFTDSRGSTRKTITGIENEVNRKILESAINFNLSPSGFDFATGGTLTSNAQTVVDASGDEWIYTLEIPECGYVVAAGTDPTVGTDYKQVSYSGAENVIFDDGSNLQKYKDADGFVNIAEHVTDESIDCASIVNDLADMARAEGKGLYCPPSQNLRFNSLVDLRFLTVNIESVITGPDNTTILQLGGVALDRRNPPQYVRRVECDDPDSWKTAQNPQVLITGAQGQHVTVLNAVFIQIAAFGDETTNPNERSTAYSRFDHIFVRRYELKGGDGTGAGLDGWINENKINIQSCLYFEILESSYKHNNNVIEGGTFEGDGKGDSVVLRLNSARSNHFKNTRFEFSPTVVFGSDSSNNTIEYSWVSVVPSSDIDIVDNGQWNSINNTMNNARPIQPLVDCDATNTTVVGDNGENNVEGLSNLVVDGDVLSTSSFTVIYQSPLIPAADTPELGVTISGVTVGGVRLNVTGYDENLNVVTSSDGEDYVILGVSDARLQPETGGTYYPSSNENKGVVAWLTRVGADKCKYVRFTVRTGGLATSFTKLFAWYRANQDYRYTGDKSDALSLPMPTQSRSRVDEKILISPFLSSQTVLANSTKEIVFNTVEDLIVGSPTACARDSSKPNLNLLFDAAVTGVNEITVYVTNVTTSNALIDSGTRPKILISSMYRTVTATAVI